MKYSLEELEELQTLSEADRESVLKEYKKGYHFLLFYGKFFGILLMVLAGEYIDGSFKGLPWFYKVPIYVVCGYLLSFIVNYIENHFVAKRVIRDLVEDHRQR